MVLPIAAIIVSAASIVVSVVALLKKKDPQIQKNMNRIMFNKSEIDNLYEITPKAEKVGKETVLTFMGETIYITENKKR